MAQPTPLMPHATASWLVDNTALSFEQIAEFCGLHILEVQAMADDLASSKYTGRDPVHSGELTHEEIARGAADPNYRLKMHRAPVDVSRTKGPRYTPVSKRQDKPDGIAWIIRHIRRSRTRRSASYRHHPATHQRDPRPLALVTSRTSSPRTGHARPTCSQRGSTPRWAAPPSAPARATRARTRWSRAVTTRANLIAELRADARCGRESCGHRGPGAEVEAWRLPSAQRKPPRT